MKSAIFSTLVLGFVPSIHSLALRDAKSGCNTPLPQIVHPNKSINLTLPNASGDVPRRYRLHLPPNYDNTQEVPLILSFHGRTQDALYQENLSQFSNASYGFRGIAVYPEGVPLVNNGNSIPQWQGDPDAPASINDIQFTLELIDHLQSRYCISPSQVYAAGKSNGGGFTGLLACDPEASQRIAAFAAVSGAFYLDTTTQKLPECKPGRLSVPLMEFHGLQDKTIKYTGALNSRGNANSTNIPAYINAWAERDGFEIGENKTITLCGTGAKKVTKYAWAGQDGNEVVVHYKYENVGHDWPSSFLNDDAGENQTLLTCKEAEATSLILEWFGKWRL